MSKSEGGGLTIDPFAKLPRLRTMRNPLDGRMIYTMEVSEWLAQGDNARRYYFGELSEDDIPSHLLDPRR